MRHEEFGAEDIHPEAVVGSGEAETTEDAWQEARGRGGARWLLLLLVIPVVALVVLQLQPSGVPSAVSTPTKSSSAPDPAPTRARSTVPAPARSAARPVVHNLGHPLLRADSKWELYARGDRAVVRLQMARGRVTTTPVPALASDGPIAFVATAAGAVVRPVDSVAGYLVPDGVPALELTGLLGQGGPVVPGPNPDHLWVQEASNGNGPDVIQLTTIDGSPAGPQMRMPANADGFIAADGGGYPMATTPGGAYSLRPDGLHRITTGRVAAVGPTAWLVVECDKANHCSPVVVDRATGKRRHLPGQINTDFPTPGLISPDGSRALVVGMDDGFPGVWLIDLDSGERHAVDVYPRGRTFLGPGSAAWSPDSRWVLLADDRGVLVAINAHTRVVHRLKIDLPDLDQVAVNRPR